MTVVLHMRDGSRVHLDRRLHLDAVARAVNEGRENGALIEFELDLTPTGQKVWVDPAEVSTIVNDR